MWFYFFKNFNPTTIAVSFFSGSVFALGLWIMIYLKIAHQALSVFYLPPLLAVLFLIPLFPFSVNLILEKEEASFGDDGVKFRRNVLFLLMALQFVPVLISIGLTVQYEDSTKPNILLIQMIANFLLLFSSLLFKFGNYKTPESSDFF